MEALLDKQFSAIEKLQLYKVGALFMEPGTGKSRTAIELVRSVNDVDYVLCLAPFRSINPLIEGTGIKDEVAKWGGFDCETEFIGIETLSSSSRTYLNIYSKLETKKRAFIIVDESLKIKNFEAQRTKRIVELGKLVEYKLILNGTPLSRNLLDIWAQMEFLSPKILNMGTAEYKNTFCEWTKVTKRIGNKVFTKEWINKYHNVDYLFKLIGHYVYEADLDLEIQQQYIDVSYIVDDEAKAEYKRLKEKYLDNEMLLAMNNNIFLEMTQKMQHTYCCTEDKFDVVKRIIESNNAEKIIIYCKYIASREECKKRFPNVTVLSIQSESMSLNLQSKNITIFFDKTWDYANRKQGKHRTYRTGQLETCMFYDLTGNVGLEDLINKNVEKKQSLLDYFKSKSINELKKEL